MFCRAVGRGCLKIMEGAGQPELSSGGRFVVVVDKLPSCMHRLLLPLTEPGSASVVEPEYNSATVQPRFVGTALPEPAGPGVAVCLLGGLFGLPARLKEGPSGCRSARSAGDWRQTRDQGPEGRGQRRLLSDLRYRPALAGCPGGQGTLMPRRSLRWSPGPVPIGGD